MVIHLHKIELQFQQHHTQLQLVEEEQLKHTQHHLVLQHPQRTEIIQLLVQLPQQVEELEEVVVAQWQTILVMMEEEEQDQEEWSQVVVVVPDQEILPLQLQHKVQTVEQVIVSLQQLQEAVVAQQLPVRQEAQQVLAEE